MPLFHAAIWKQNNWFVAQCVEINLATQGGSEEEAHSNIGEALALHLDLPGDAVTVQVDPSWLARLRSIDPPRIENEKSAESRQALQSPQFSDIWPEQTFISLRFQLEEQGFNGIDQRAHHARFIRHRDDEIDTAILPHYTSICGYVAANILRQAGLR